MLGRCFFFNFPTALISDVCLSVSLRCAHYVDVQFCALLPLQAEAACVICCGHYSPHARWGFRENTRLHGERLGLPFECILYIPNITYRRAPFSNCQLKASKCEVNRITVTSLAFLSPSIYPRILAFECLCLSFACDMSSSPVRTPEFVWTEASFHLLTFAALCLSVCNHQLGIGWRTRLSPEKCPPTLITVALASTACVCMCVCVWPKPSLETAPKCWQCGVMPCLSHCLSHKYFWPLGSTLRLPLLAVCSHHRTGDSGVGTQPSCLTSPSFLLSWGPLGY